MANNFKIQIDEDIAGYQSEKGQNLPEIMKNEWAFNYWILDKLFFEDEDLIVDKITDYHDSGIDCYEWYEDTHELFIIQNKYYDENTHLTHNYVKQNFLVNPLAVLEKDSYLHCPDLQKIYNEHKDDEKFSIRLQIYVTNDSVDANVLKDIKDFNKQNGPRKIAEVFYLKDIQNKFYGEIFKPRKEIKIEIESVNGGTILNIKNQDYGLNNGIDAKYVLAPVSCIYRMMQIAQKKEYSLFEDNIREYLGNKGINRNIYKTLKDEDERKNFFYYNNGITIICDEMSGHSQKKSNTPHVGVSFTIKNPQIVNGCQTVNSIYSALKEYADDDIETQFSDTFVMLKILQIDPSDENEGKLAKSIVRYNNSQNSIDEKNFVANNQLFTRLKSEFMDRGYLLLTKQSDKNTYSESYKKKSEQIKFFAKSADRRNIYGLTSKPKTSDLYIPLEKLLQVILAFKDSALAAYTQKKDVLRPDTTPYQIAVDFIKSSSVTSDVLLSLYLLYMRFEKEKNMVKDMVIIPFYAIDGFSRFECKGDASQIIPCTVDNSAVEAIVKLYKNVSDAYAQEFEENNKVDYIQMIKMSVDYDRLDAIRRMLKRYN